MIYGSPKNYSEHAPITARSHCLIAFQNSEKSHAKSRDARAVRPNIMSDNQSDGEYISHASANIRIISP